MLNFDSISIKSKIGVEFRRYALRWEDVQSFDKFYTLLEAYHHLDTIPFVVFYTDPQNSLLPINNDDNLAKAISTAKHISLYNRKHQPLNEQAVYSRHNNNLNAHNYPHYSYQNDGNNNSHTNQNHSPRLIRRPFLNICIEKKSTFLDYHNGNVYNKYKKNQTFKGISNLILQSNDQNLRPSIGMPEDFRQVSSIIDVDILPETCRRVRIVKHGTDRPLGFYIRDGTYRRTNIYGQKELVTGIFISRLVPGGLAESSGLLAVNDEVLEVNGIQVTHGKTLDQVTDMMVANSSNLIMTIRPVMSCGCGTSATKA